MNSVFWFFAFYGVFVTGLFVGMVVGWYARRPQKRTVPAGEDAEIIDHGEEVPPPTYIKHVIGAPSPVARPVVQTQQQIEGDAEIIDRPDAARLNELEEDDSVRESKEAVAETLKQFPSVQEILASRRKFMNGVQNG